MGKRRLNIKKPVETYIERYLPLNNIMLSRGNLCTVCGSSIIRKGFPV